MAVKIGKRGVTPNWTEHDWTPQSRIEAAQRVMAFSPRDWSVFPNSVGVSPDPETWAIYVLMMADNKDEALLLWWDFCEEHNQ